MYIVKRDGRKQNIQFDKITERIQQLVNRHPILNIDPIIVAQKVVAGLYPGVTTKELDLLACEVAISLSMSHPDYGTLASRLAISNLHKSTSSSYEETCDLLYNHVNIKTNKHAPLISEECYHIIKNNIVKLQAVIDYDKDYDYEYFGFKTLEKAYLLKINGNVIERIQHLYMRVAVGIHKNNIDKVIESYKLMSDKKFIHATPTLYNAGTCHPSLSSCFLIQIKEDSVSGIYDTKKSCALISKSSGGIGISIHDVRAKGSYITSINGTAEGIVPMLRGFNEDAKHITQGSKRKGSIAIYLEPHHAEIEAFLDLKKNHGNPDLRCLDLFYALWVSDLFMQRVEKNLNWSLFCPNEAPGLSELYGDEFVELYERYEKEGRARKVMKAQDLWFKIVNTQMETGLPYLCFKDTINKHNNQSNLGTIKSSNLCVSGDTYILTNKGQIQIKELADKEVTIWNGEEWSDTIVRQTGVNQKLVKVILDNGVEIKCTPYHKFYLQDGTEVRACELKQSDTLIKYNLPFINEFYNLVEGYTKKFEDGGILRSTDKEFLLNVRLTLQLIGIDSIIQNDSLKLCDCIIYAKLGNTIFSSKICINVVSVEPLKEREDTYCFTESKRNMGMFNGILTKNCSEITQYTSPEEVAVCNLCSIALPKCVINGQFDHQALYDIVYHVIGNLNNVIDETLYPIPEAKYSNLKHRPVGLGVQGLADVFFMLKYPFDSMEAKKLNQEIFETMYFAAAQSSCDLAKIHGPYESFKGSPASKGILCPDMWHHTPTNRWNFDQLRKNVVEYGLRNSLLISGQPTASTASILSNNECFEPITSNIYSRGVLAGEFIMVNKYLIHDLIELKLWNDEMKDKIIINQGSIQNIKEIPNDLKLLYRTVWEISQKQLIDMSRDRGYFIDQSQSFNCFMAVPNKTKITSMHFYSWKQGLKTGQYYLRTKPSSNTIQFTVNQEVCESCM